MMPPPRPFGGRRPRRSCCRRAVGGLHTGQAARGGQRRQAYLGDRHRSLPVPAVPSLHVSASLEPAGPLTTSGRENFPGRTSASSRPLRCQIFLPPRSSALLRPSHARGDSGPFRSPGTRHRRDGPGDQPKRNLSLAITLGTFTKLDDGAYTGMLKTLHVTTGPDILPVDRSSKKAPDHRVYTPSSVTRSAAAGARSPNRAASSISASRSVARNSGRSGCAAASSSSSSRPKTAPPSSSRADRRGTRRRARAPPACRQRQAASACRRHASFGRGGHDGLAVVW